jgi:hypothetical protein
VATLSRNSLQPLHHLLLPQFRNTPTPIHLILCTTQQPRLRLLSRVMLLLSLLLPLFRQWVPPRIHQPSQRIINTPQLPANLHPQQFLQLHLHQCNR